jgi:hypothetical protein
MKSLSIGCAVLFAGAIVAQPPEVKPGPEHAMLKEMAGAWKGKFKMQGTESDCTCTYRMELGDLWLTSTFQTKMGDQTFRGRGMDTYDAASKKFKTVWFDSMSTKPMLMDGTYDAATKTMTMTGMATGPDGKEVKHTITTTMPDKDTMKSRMTMASPSGEAEVFTIDYKRDPNPPGRGGRGKGKKADPKPNP